MKSSKVMEVMEGPSGVCIATRVLVSEVKLKAQTHPTRPTPTSLHHAFSKYGVNQIKFYRMRIVIVYEVCAFRGASCYVRPDLPGYCRT